jgi:hypothetical protein
MSSASSDRWASAHLSRVQPRGAASIGEKFHSTAGGEFRISLPPGHYLIDEDPKSPAEGLLSPVEVTVRKGEFEEVRLFYVWSTGWS